MNKEILEITKKFHDTYEKLASEYTYETREDTKVFDINSNNGKLMYATVNEIVSPILEENKKLNGTIQTYDILLKANVEENNQLKRNWNKLREYIKETKLKEFEKDYGKRYGKTFTQAEIVVCNMILDKMLELERRSDSNVKD